MSTFNRHLAAAVVAVLLIGAGAFLPRLLASRETVREIRVTARGMAFHVEDVAGLNPSVLLSAGEQVRLTFRNDDRGMIHDFAIPEWGVRTGNLEFGVQKSIVFEVPRSGSGAAYQCTPHSAMMSGRILIAR